jgi:flagellin-specific chaperone FliS
MRSKNGLLAKNIKAIRVTLLNLKRRGTLEPVQIEGIDRVLELVKALAHSLDTSDGRRARAQLEEISKWLVKTFTHLEVGGE